MTDLQAQVMHYVVLADLMRKRLVNVDVVTSA